jgi:hypothetical protein
MLKQNAQMNFNDNANVTQQDPTEWLKSFVNTTITSLYYPLDCNNMFNAANYSYQHDALNFSDAMVAWSAFSNTTAFNEFWKEIQQEYSTNVPVNWYQNNGTANHSWQNPRRSRKWYHTPKQGTVSYVQCKSYGQIQGEFKVLHWFGRP